MLKFDFDHATNVFIKLSNIGVTFFIVTNYMMNCFAKDLELEIALSTLIELSFYP